MTVVKFCNSAWWFCAESVPTPQARFPLEVPRGTREVLAVLGLDFTWIVVCQPHAHRLSPRSTCSQKTAGSLASTTDCSVVSKVQRRRHALREFYKDSIHSLLQCLCATINGVEGLAGVWIQPWHAYCVWPGLFFFFFFKYLVLFVWLLSCGKSLVIPVELLIDWGTI